MFYINISKIPEHFFTKNNQIDYLQIFQMRLVGTLVQIFWHFLPAWKPAVSHIFPHVMMRPVVSRSEGFLDLKQKETFY